MKAFFTYLWRAGSIEMLCFVVAFAIMARAASPWPLRFALAAFAVWFFANVWHYNKTAKKL